MGNKATLGPMLRVGLTGLVLAAVAVAQAPDWRRVGNSALDLELAGLATGPVDRVWYSATGDQIWARSLSGKTFVTNDLDHWVAAAPGSLAPPVPEGRTITIPENGAQVRNPASASPRVYAFRQFVHRSDNSGKNWENLTAFRGLSIIGEGLRDLAVSPTNEDEIAQSVGSLGRLLIEPPLHVCQLRGTGFIDSGFLCHGSVSGECQHGRGVPRDLARGKATCRHVRSPAPMRCGLESVEGDSHPNHWCGRIGVISDLADDAEGDERGSEERCDTDRLR